MEVAVLKPFSRSSLSLLQSRCFEVPVYTANARIVLDKDRNAPSNLGQDLCDKERPSFLRFLQSEVELVKSPGGAARRGPEAPGQQQRGKGAHNIRSRGDYHFAATEHRSGSHSRY